MPKNVAFDLGLYCLPISHKKDIRLIWVKKNIFSRQFVNRTWLHANNKGADRLTHSCSLISTVVKLYPCKISISLSVPFFFF